MATRPIIFGEIPNLPEGHWFEGRREMMPTRFHRNWAAGIDGNGNEGTAAIVLSGGYEDDEDNGEEIIYTGAGGNDPNTGKQVKDQSWKTPGNAGLRKSLDEGLPVRVIRGYTHKSAYSPEKGYTYGGLYSVVDAWEEVGKSGFKICRFKLLYIGTSELKKTAEKVELKISNEATKRKVGSILRIIRDTKIAHDIKKLYDFKCQVCQFALPTKSGHYAEGAHIKPLGTPHNGQDSSDNLLCLCPNHHVMFDRGSFSVKDDLELIGEVSGTLFLHQSHKLNNKNLKYHRESHGYH
ncbi:YDG/SRA domain-containing protein [Sphingobacterium multivorum]|uniref:YDG/SRA domain-containing protein n=1 Tax=Sphingobacterium multivorum TaxID=28454 RepID=UPI0028AAEEFE|nr:YDG/SRA domain-containing protein [Sphingobacterium multivorum]